MSEPIIYTSYRDDDDEDVVSYQRMEQEGEEALARCKEEKEKEAEELSKRYHEQRAEVLRRVEQQRAEAEKQEKQLSEKPKPKKSKIRRFLFKFKNEGILSALWYILMVVWFGFVGITIIVSEMHIILKIVMIAGCLWWGFYTFVLHYCNTENKE